MIDALTRPVKFAGMPGEAVDEAPRCWFSGHHTFAYWCLNVRMRAQGKEKARVCVKRNTETAQ